MSTDPPSQCQVVGIDVNMLEKHMFVPHTKHMQQKINGSTSFAIDNMYYINFKI